MTDAAAPASTGSMDMVERELELQTLSALLDEAAAGRGRVAVVEGPAGIGKSRLLAGCVAAPAPAAPSS